MNAVTCLKATTATFSSTTLLFEQPTNETLRLCLRLEHLFHEFHQNVSTASLIHTQTAMEALLRLQQVTDRPDLKSRVTQVLSQQASTLAQLDQFTQVDHARLSHILHQLDQTLSILHENRQKIGESLRQNRFLSHIASHLHDPAGPCPFNTPAYLLWQQLDPVLQTEQLYRWFSDYQILEQAIILILHITRESSCYKTIEVKNGYYQQALDHSPPCQLIRLSLPAVLGLFPEISANRHHLSIRFLEIGAQQSGHLQPSGKLTAALSCCR